MPEPEPIGPSIDFVLRKAEIQRDQHDAIDKILKATELAAGELFLHELEYLIAHGWEPKAAIIPALNNIMVRGRVMTDKMRADIARIEQETRDRVAKLEAEFRGDAA